eukprot:4402812-Prymnesium_polylepis.1
MQSVQLRTARLVESDRCRVVGQKCAVLKSRRLQPHTRAGHEVHTRAGHEVHTRAGHEVHTHMTSTDHNSHRRGGAARAASGANPTPARLRASAEPQAGRLTQPQPSPAAQTLE